MTRPGQRFDGGPDAGLLSPVRVGTPVEEAVGEHAWLRAMLEAEAALARAQARLGTVPEKAAEVITRVAATGRFDVRALAVAARETANPVVGLVRALTGAVAAEDAEAAEYVHRGSTSQDVLDTGAMLVCRRALDLVHGDLVRTAGTLAALAEEHRDTAMAGRTLALHAVPTTFGLKAAGWRSLVLDAALRIESANRALPVSLGGAAGTLAGYVQYVEGVDPESYPERLVAAYAAETGLARPVLPWHALRTPVADVAAALAFTAGALGKFAVDVQVLARTEIAEAAEPDAAGRGASSAMPHKRNPVLSTLIRSASLQVPAMAGALTQCLVAEDERSAGVWHAEWLLLRECLRLSGGAAHTAAELASGLTARPERMRQNLDLTSSQIVTERLAAALAPHLGRTRSKELLTAASITADREGRPLAEVLRGLPEVTAHLTGEPLTRLLDPTTYTGAARGLVARALATAEAEPEEL
ncbi:3-carboxy-cis,cis-muconate cycloisomerase [Streptomyces sp. Cmuel-A718b]|uniref:3-carboxy-cis,cis-muconate cycloisomerase n=1 Tax=Streptomyces sp. Cmuel-A718b TaxID=697328 RepID=UPI00081ED673|nr:3-carboxy-cis,cis-muconate cycloisomerase [Streptomyces sp. Cmuel-A718b]SCF74624.1 3-carboxy-cis,cis-muconate cycloisomerase [Streptomyces sp. Cmuel-A718b]